MTKQEFQKLHGFSDVEMQQIADTLRVFNGTIVSIKEVSNA